MKINNSIIALVSIAIILYTLTFTYYIFESTSIVTGQVINPNATITLCVNKPPTPDFSKCSTTATVDTLYSCRVNTTDNESSQSYTFTDNTSLFNIGSSNGSISFTPNSSDIGTYHINITATDNSPCTNNFDFKVLTLNVQAAEAPAEKKAAAEGAIGGGPTVEAKRILDVDIDVEFFKVLLKQGSFLERTLTLSNDGNVDVEISISTNLEDIISFSKTFIILPPGSREEIVILFKANLVDPGVYVGKIFVRGFVPLSGQTFEKTIPIIVEVETKIVLFDLSQEIPSQYQEIYPGDTLLTYITLFNLYETGPADVQLIYTVRDFQGRTIYSEEETVKVETQTTLGKIITIPEDAEPGTYVLSVMAKAKGSIGTSSETFEVISKEISKPAPPEYRLTYMLLLVIALLLFIFFFLWYQHHQAKKRSFRVKVFHLHKHIGLIPRKDLLQEKLLKAKERRKTIFAILHGLGLVKTEQEKRTALEEKKGKEERYRQWLLEKERLEKEKLEILQQKHEKELILKHQKHLAKLEAKRRKEEEKKKELQRLLEEQRKKAELEHLEQEKAIEKQRQMGREKELQQKQKEEQKKKSIEEKAKKKSEARLRRKKALQEFLRHISLIKTQQELKAIAKEKKKLQNERDILHETFLNHLIERLQKNISIIDRHESLLTADEQRLIALEEQGLQKIREELKSEEDMENELHHAEESLQEYEAIAERGETKLHDKISRAREVYSEYEIKARSIRQTILKLLDNTEQRLKELKEKEEEEALQQKQRRKLEAEEERKRMEELEKERRVLAEQKARLEEERRKDREKERKKLEEERKHLQQEKQWEEEQKRKEKEMEEQRKQAELKIKFKKEVERLEKQLRLLKQGYESGFISNQSYELDKDKIERRMLELEDVK